MPIIITSQLCLEIVFFIQVPDFLVKTYHSVGQCFLNTSATSLLCWIYRIALARIYRNHMFCVDISMYVNE